MKTAQSLARLASATAVCVGLSPWAKADPALVPKPQLSLPSAAPAPVASCRV